MADRMASSANTTTPNTRSVRNPLEWNCRKARTRTVELDGWQTQLLGNLSVFDFPRLFQRKALDTFGHVRARGNCAPTTKGLEFDVRDEPALVDPNL